MFSLNVILIIVFKAIFAVLFTGFELITIGDVYQAHPRC
jgi:hypothetical protein